MAGAAELLNEAADCSLKAVSWGTVVFQGVNLSASGVLTYFMTFSKVSADKHGARPSELLKLVSSRSRQRTLYTVVTFMLVAFLKDPSARGTASRQGCD